MSPQGFLPKSTKAELRVGRQTILKAIVAPYEDLRLQSLPYTTSTFPAVESRAYLLATIKSKVTL